MKGERLFEKRVFDIEMLTFIASCFHCTSAFLPGITKQPNKKVSMVEVYRLYDIS